MLIQQTFVKSDHTQFSMVKEGPYRQAEQADWGNFAAIVRNADFKSLQREPKYPAAKAGNGETVLTLTDFNRYREAQASRAQQTFDHAHDAFWACGDSLRTIRTEIEQHAHDQGIAPRALIGTVFPDDPPSAYARRVSAAIAASPGAHALEKRVHNARQYLNKQLRRTPAPAAKGDECTLST